MKHISYAMPKLFASRFLVRHDIVPIPKMVYVMETITLKRLVMLEYTQLTIRQRPSFIFHELESHPEKGRLYYCRVSILCNLFAPKDIYWAS